jgi:uncharacterized protein
MQWVIFAFLPRKRFRTSLLLSPKVFRVLLLVASNVFMALAWYGHLKFKNAPLYTAVLASWMIAFVEYWLAVPADRIGHSIYSAAELETMQEIITLVVFAAFSVLFLKEAITWNHLAGFALIAGGAALVFRSRETGGEVTLVWPSQNSS